ncbi:DUF3494 domain-containing protein [Candidatus Saccharibacteria bacterium]|nr:DUF3494 domain-containing protein [Candidatus Saccharibacteria bacterium]
MNIISKSSAFKVLVLSIIVGVTLPTVALAAPYTQQVNLATADNFAVLGGSAITNTGSTVINGNVGLAPGSAISGFPPGLINGTQYTNNSTATKAKTDLVTAYNDAASRTPVTSVIAAGALGSMILTPGVYTAADSTFELDGPLTLDGEGDPNAVFIFQAASSLITAGASTVILQNGAQACNVFWQVTSSATLGTNSTFKGNILSLTSITATTGANVVGSLLARNGAVTLDANTITNETCAGGEAFAAPALPNTGVETTSSRFITPVVVTLIALFTAAGAFYAIRTNQNR